ncbi:bifunctional 3-phenylpropionate/cinnamic acid dioxygenase ferredoxin subunit [Nocardioides sp. zg-DK7169]|uniref:bifunctional 3-phenylpropionate/cinnamic acid dioxygenase ferredoxin subunit n=1 Tax=Nocardioides sp. zg-DK7169 TaxID=2736600 RepID=UPI0015545C1C|nr:bifunctional 3-phenylpropionate/cinnamic acid dioxygenase ferredoxin subunit [Nocardioides sp. zg-DK7169]
MSWLKVCAVSDIEDGEAHKVDSVRPPIAVYHLDGEFFATADTCSHADSSLSEGYVEDGEVECVWHFAKFCIRTGAAKSLPATEPIRTYEVKVEDGHVHVLLDASVIAIPA